MPEPTLLRVLIIERHWQKFGTFEAQFRRAGRELAEQAGEPGIATVTVSPRQFERWYAGKVKTVPYPDSCRVLEHLFGHPVRRLLAPAQHAIPELRRSPPKRTRRSPRFTMLNRLCSRALSGRLAATTACVANSPDGSVRMRRCLTRKGFSLWQPRGRGSSGRC